MHFCSTFHSRESPADPLGQVVARTTQKSREESVLVATLDTDVRTYIPDFECARLRPLRGMGQD